MNVPGIVLHAVAGARLDEFLSAPSHAVLLAGPSGTGKTHVAAALAAGLLHTKQPEAHAYYRAISPEKSGTIGIEQIRSLIGFFQLKVPGTAQIRRVAVLQDADTMSLEAQNALLKVLEEPPADSVLILTSSRPQQLLITIRSRVQLMQLAHPEKPALAQHFATLGYAETAVMNTLLRSGTDIAEAARLLAEGTDAADPVMDTAKRALGSSTYDRLLLVDGLAKQKDAAAAFVSAIATIASAGLEAAARKSAASVDRWKAVLQAADTAGTALERSGNAKLVLTELMLAL